MIIEQVHYKHERLMTALRAKADKTVVEYERLPDCLGYKLRVLDTVPLGKAEDAAKDTGAVVYDECTMKPEKKSCAALSWAELGEIAQSGHAAEVLTLGDCKPLLLKTGKDVVMQIVGFGQDVESVTGDPVGITWVMRDLLDEEMAMNTKNTNAGGWEKSDLRQKLNGEIRDALPDEVQNAIKSVLKVTYNADGERQITEDNLFLLSEWELFGRQHYGSEAAEGRWYDYFKQEGVDYRKKSRDREICWYWLRSPDSSTSTAFCFVYSGGSAGNAYASASYGVAFGFCF